MKEDTNIGKTFGIYTILEVHSERYKDGHLLYQCRCNVCKSIVTKKLLDIKRSKECHHLDVHWDNIRISKTFQKMLSRCYDPNSKDYRWYGAKGIHICTEWYNNPKSFEVWAYNNGYADNLTIDRIDATKDYCPENCQWIPLADNSRKAGKVTWIAIDDETLTGWQWATRVGVGVNTINTAVRDYGIEKAKELLIAMLKEPPSTKHRKAN